MMMKILKEKKYEILLRTLFILKMNSVLFFVKNNNMEKLKDYLIAISGSIISAFGTACFLLPNQLSSGGFSGIATILYYLLNIPMGTTIIFLNIPIFIFAYFREGKEFLFCCISSE